MKKTKILRIVLALLALPMMLQMTLVGLSALLSLQLIGAALVLSSVAVYIGFIYDTLKGKNESNSSSN